MGLRKKSIFFLVIIMLTASYRMINVAPPAEAGLIEESPYPVVYVYPNFTDVGVGETFTIAVIGFNFTESQDPKYPTGNLYGFDIQFAWDPTIIQYVNYSNPDPSIGGYWHPNVTVPVEDYPAPNPPSPYPGALHKDVIEVKNVVNESKGIPDADPETMAWFSYASMYPTAEPQNGNVTFFTMNFTVLRVGESPLNIPYCELSDVNGYSIYRKVYSGTYRTHGVPEADFTYQPTIPVANKSIEFTATVTGNASNIVLYMWDFGDGVQQNTTEPMVKHDYTTAGDKTVSLKVVDAYGVESGWARKTLTVIPFRDLRVSEVKLPTTRIKVDPQVLLRFNATVENFSPIVENCTVSAYYNTTAVDPADPYASNWNFSEAKNISISEMKALVPGKKTLTLSVNTTIMEMNASYYMFVNITTGIPSGYERNTTDNYRLSDDLIFVTNVDIHEIAIVKFDCVWQFGAVLRFPPLIEGEDATIRLTILNNGTSPDTANITLYIDNVSVEDFSIQLEWGEQKDVQPWTEPVAAGKHNLTIVVESFGFSTNETIALRVVKPPLLQVGFAPSEPIVNQTTTLNASESIHQDPEGNITVWTWKLFAPGVDWTTAAPTATANGTIVTYNFTIVGNWTVVLDVTDNFSLEYDLKRGSTSAYRSWTLLTVKEEAKPPSKGIPIEYIIAIVLAIVIIAVVIGVLYRRRREAKKPKEVRTEET